jgi:hypothetical protein
MYRVTRGEVGFDTESIESAFGDLRGLPPGRYDVVETPADDSLDGHNSRFWGRMIHHQGGQVESETWLWSPSAYRRPSRPA